MFPVMARVAGTEWGVPGAVIGSGWKVFGCFAIQTVFFVLFNMASGQSLFIFSKSISTNCNISIQDAYSSSSQPQLPIVVQ
jgi:hypothetical protein